jgi:hypothetical protein
VPCIPPARVAVADKENLETVISSSRRIAIDTILACGVIALLAHRIVTSLA